jgi:hypothetical protein
MRARGLALLGILALVACRKGAVGSATSAEAGAGSASASASAVQPAVVPARCKGEGAGVALANAGGMDELEIGDAVAVGREVDSGWAVGIVHRVGSSRMAAIAFLTPDATAARIVDLAPTLGDAPPPHLAARGRSPGEGGDDLLAASYVLSKRTDVRELALYVVPKAGDPKVVASIPQQRDDSLAFDLAPGLVVWDEASAGPSPRGIIRAAELLPGGPPGEGHDAVGPAHDVSPADSDAEMPRLAPAAQGYIVFWLARRPEEMPDAAGTGGLVGGGTPTHNETPGDVRAYSWLESSGAPPRRLTSASGHVSAYDVESLAGGDTLVVARDDGESVDGSGGALLRIRVHAGSTDPPLALPGDGLGRGAPIFVDGPAAWISWIGPHEAARLLPLDSTGAPVGPPSAEPLLDDARPLAFLPGSQQPKILTAAPGDATAQLRVIACSQP